MAKTILDYAEGQVSRQDASISRADQIKSLGKAGVLRRPVVFPFFFELTIANGVSSSKNFPEMQNLSMRSFIIESDGELTIKSNLFQLLSGSQFLVLNGTFEMVVPVDHIFPVDFVPVIEYANASGSDRELTFYGWLTNLPRS